MGNIYHEWNGTVLTVTSDSGTSSADLKGDMGVRGPQGIPGGEAGELIENKMDKFGEIITDAGTTTIDSTSTLGRLIWRADELFIDMKYGGSIGSTGAGEVAIHNLADVNPGTKGTDAINKNYVDGLVGDVEAALDSVIAIQNELIGGGEQ